MYSIEDVESIVDVNKLNGKTLKISIRPTLQCNYNCSYCIQRTFKDFGTNLSKEQFFSFTDRLKEIIRPEIENIFINFVGGEPTIVENLKDFIVYFSDVFKDKKITCLITTNFSKPVDYFKEITSIKNIYKFFLSVSCHDEYVVNFNTFLKKCKEVKSEKVGININLVTNEQNVITQINRFCLFTLNDIKSTLVVDKTSDVYNSLNNYYGDILKYLITFRKGNHMLITKTGEEKNYFGFSRLVADIKEYPPKLKGFYCDAGYIFLRVNHSGEVFSCQSRNDFLGDVSNFNFSNNYTLCTAKSNCCGDFTIMARSLESIDNIKKRILSRGK